MKSRVFLSFLILFVTAGAGTWFSLSHEGKPTALPYGMAPEATGSTQLASKMPPPFPISEECQQFIKNLPPEVEYGWVESPEEPGNTNLPPVYAFYYHRPFTQAPPFIFFNGGPSADSHSLWTAFEELRSKGRLLSAVFLDQRGTGCSSPYRNDRNGNVLRFWGSAGIVLDAEQVRKKLGLEKWMIFGQSYGSFIVQRYLIDFPQAVTKAIGHGASSLEDFSDFMQLRSEHQLNVIHKYFEIYPEDSDRVVKIVKKKPCYNSLCGGSFLNSIAKIAMGFTTSWPDLHRAIESIDKMADQKRDPSGEAPLGVAMAISMLDLGNMGIQCQAARTRMLKMGGRPEWMALAECWNWFELETGNTPAVIESYDKAFVGIYARIRIRPSLIRESLERYPDLKYYLFSGQWDYYAPPALMAKAAAEIGPRVKYEKINGAGHESFLSEEILQLLLRD